MANKGVPSRPGANTSTIVSLDCEEARLLVRDAARGGLDEAKKARIEAHVGSCAKCRALLASERALDHLLEERLPQYGAPLALKRRLRERIRSVGPLARVPRKPTPKSRWLGPAAISFAAGIVFLFSLHRTPVQAGSAMVSEAVADHLRVVYRDRPTDVESGEPHQVKPWFTGRLDFALPSVFAGDDEFTLEGGSVGYYLNRKAAVLVYKRRLHRISLFVFRAEGLSFPRGEHALKDHAVAVREERGFHVLLWRDGELGYSLVSDLNTDELLRLSADVSRAN
jgi:anti-sigma factor RsiW